MDCEYASSFTQSTPTGFEEEANDGKDQSGSVPANGTHLQSLDLRLPQAYPVSCHLDFDDQDHKQISQPSGSFIISNATDTTPQIWSGASSSASASASASATDTTSSSGLPSLHPYTSAPDSSSSSSGISGGAIAGIVVGVILGISLVVGALIFFCLRKRRRGRQNSHTSGYLARKDMKEHHKELDGYSGGELPAESKPWEKDGVQQPAEVLGETADKREQGPVEMEGSQSFLGNTFSTKSKKSLHR